MSYEKLNLADGDKLTAEHIGHIESGIQTAELSGGLTADEKSNLLLLLAVSKDTSAETLVAYEALSTAWGGSSGGTVTPEPDEPTENLITVLSTHTERTWNLNNPKVWEIKTPFTPKVDMTLKGLKFKIQSEAAVSCEISIRDGEDSDKPLEAVTVDIPQNTEQNGAVVEAVFNTPLTANHFYKIRVSTKDGSQVLHYPIVSDSVTTNNNYFSITRESNADYQWSNNQIRYAGYVMFTTP